MWTRRSSSTARSVAPLKVLAQRLAFFLLIGTAFALMMLSRADAVFIERVRTNVTDAVAPIFSALSRPVATTRELITEAQAFMALKDSAVAMRTENSRLKRWRHVALQLEDENRKLRDLLRFPQAPSSSYISARVIADSGGAFVRSVVLDAGLHDGITKGQAAVTGDGFMGRVVDVGRLSSRVLLLTDLNSRVPVVTQKSQFRAILAGDNTDKPHLMHLPVPGEVSIGERVVTSGHGGAFPPGIPIGRIAEIKDGVIAVAPFVRMDKVTFVRVIDFGMGGILPPASSVAEAKKGK